MDIKKPTRAILFPHPVILILLVIVSAVFLIYSMVTLGTESPVAIASYVLSAYTLTAVLLRIPAMIRFYKSFREENKYVKRWREDTHLRVNTSLYGSLVFNAAYAVFHGWLGVYHRSFWYCSLSGYYILLAIVRFSLVRYTGKNRPGENMQKELVRYRTCGIVFLMMNLAISLMIFFMVYWNRTFRHHEITTIALAAYTFTSLTLAIINAVKYRKYKSPVYSASKAISLASACVSMLTLESTMLTTFGGDTMDLFTRRVFLGASGGVISAFIIAMAVYMIANGTKRIKRIASDKEYINEK